MKIKIENFGPIHSFEMDLDKDLHLLYGENNVGKSYAISLVFLILRKLQELDRFGSNRIEYSEERVLESVSVPEDGEVDVTDYFRNILKDLLSELFLPSLINALINTRGESHRWKNRHNTERTSIWLYFDSYSVEIQPDIDKLLIIGEIRFQCQYVLKRNIGDSQGKNRIEIEKVSLSDEEIEIEFLSPSPGKRLPLYELHDHIAYDGFYLPATRAGVYSGLGGLSSIFARLSQIRHLLPGERIDLPSLPEPTSDFFLRIASIAGEPKDGLLKEVYAQMEKELIKGEVRFNSLTKRIQFYQLDIDMLFDLEQTSSMVAELSILIAFLKFVIHHPHPQQPEAGTIDFSELYKTTPILFIEEPEAHLHPEIQVKLTEYLVELSKLGVKVVITTHSNYLFSKASNLILKGELKEEQLANYHMIMTDKGSIINPKDTLHDWGLEDENFVEVIEGLLDERLQAAEDFNANVAH